MSNVNSLFKSKFIYQPTKTDKMKDYKDDQAKCYRPPKEE